MLTQSTIKLLEVAEPYLVEAKIKTVGLRITGGWEENVKDFLTIAIPGEYAYAHHSPDDEVKYNHTHFVIVRDWSFDPNGKDTRNERDKLKKNYINKVIQNNLKKCDRYALSFFENTLYRNCCYLAHGGEVVYSSSLWDPIKALKPQWQELTKTKKTDDDINKRLAEPALGLTLYNIVGVMRRFARLKGIPESETFHTVYLRMVDESRFRPSRDLIERGIPTHIVSEYENGTKTAQKTLLDRMIERGHYRG
jgi:hypothetical protein